MGSDKCTWTEDLARETIFSMQRVACLALIAVGLVGDACSKALQVGGADSGRDGYSLDCTAPPPESCGYDCQDGRWIRIPLLCMPAPDGAIAPDGTTVDTAPACVQVTSNDAGPVAACPCLRTGACPAGGPYGLACNDDGVDCYYGSNSCQIVTCTCRRSDAGLHWDCQVLLF